ncbi:DNA double-strand break repair protein Mre11 [Haloarchaeobius sp. HME9146]|uniref:DNA double-strand break repair protein Mre11 n=1 Tax=Haloarchaeobius sp. HME9146 TaxID=2978732 RepID=UPI0021C09A28|nr:DNA double-strand break repair protein Mre11 [Haloarchaeobius sp. HME9146]MCT9096151.1 DNA double-strand break repair protein Mre11 [Haloarchaeobius sp. HME9146]
MTRVIHTGDTHLGYRQYHSPARREDFLDAFRRVIADAIDDDVDAVVHAGDLFHDRRPGLQDLQGTVAALRDLADADIPFLAVVGNHEGKRDGQWLDLFADIGLATRLGREPYVLGDTAFYGLDFVPRSRRDDLEYDFAPHDTDHAMLVTHGLFEPFAHADWDTERLIEESSVDFDALLLGDNHAPGVEQLGDTWVTYCGSTERVSASERDDRGYNIVTADDEVTITRRGIPDNRPFRFVDVDLAPGEGVERVREAVREHDCEDAVVIVSVTGDGDPVSPAAVEEFAIDRGALVARVTDRREFDEDSGVEVSFADPDEAVRERVRELGLSQAARDVDETVRASKVADSNVRDEVKDRVQALVDDDLGAFEAVEAADGATEADASTDTAEADSGTAEAEPAPTESDPEPVEAEAAPAESEPAPTEAEATVAGDDDGQASMEDFE